jgi:hypothetical protein
MERTITITGNGKDVIGAAKEIIKHAIDNPISANSMQTLEYTTIDKSTWGEGEWQNEPDKRQWRDEETGYPCLIVRTPHTGSLCGYVGVSESHPCFGKDGDDCEISVHGGITFAEPCLSGDESRGICHIDPSNDNVWWLGFDTAHLFDYMPAINALFKTMPDFPKHPEMSEGFRDVYRNMDYVTSEVQSLARQLKVLEVAA